MIENARWADEKHTAVACTLDGTPGAYIPVGSYLLDGFEGQIAEFEPAPIPADDVPSSVPIWQFACQAAVEGIIDQDGAMGWSARGVVPDTLAKKVAGLVTDAHQRFVFMIRLASLVTVERADPLVPQLGALFGKDSAALDQFFRDASKLGA